MRYIIALLFFVSTAQAELCFTQVGWGGRLGDQLLMYVKIKYFCKKMNAKFELQSFEYADQLELWNRETRVVHRKPHRGELRDTVPASLKSGLYEVSYWVKSPTWKECLEVSTWYDVWQDKEFLASLRQLIAPIHDLNLVNPPQNMLSVAIHIRKGGGFDLPLKNEGQAPGISSTPIKYSDIAWPLKFVPDEYYVEQLKWLSEYYGDKPMYVYIFTDDQNPQRLVDKFKSINKPNIMYDYRKTENHHTMNVLEDLFSMVRFDCMIRSASNFPQISQLIGDHELVIYPEDAQWINGKLKVTKVGRWKRPV